MKYICILALFSMMTLAASAVVSEEKMDYSEIKLPERGLCAHRGEMTTHPENTLAAFREAIKVGAHMIEFDVFLTKDKQLAVIHDRTVNRTTDGEGRVADMTLAELKKLDAGSWKSEKFAGERIPTLKEVLDIMPLNVWLNVHLKGDEELGKAVAEVIVEENRLHQAFLACEAEAAAGARSVEPNILICNMDRGDSPEHYIDMTFEMKADFIQLRGGIKPEIRGYTEKLKEHGIKVNYFGTTNAEEVRQLFDLGVEFPLVDNIVELMPFAEKEFGIKPVVPINK